jgi:hypothetical protein
LFEKKMMPSLMNSPKKANSLQQPQATNAPQGQQVKKRRKDREN